MRLPNTFLLQLLPNTMLRKRRLVIGYLTLTGAVIWMFSWVIKSTPDIPQPAVPVSKEQQDSTVQHYFPDEREALHLNIHKARPLKPNSQHKRNEIIARLRDDLKLVWRETPGVNPWRLADSWADHQQVFPYQSSAVGGVLHALATRPIVRASQGLNGTQLKLELLLEGGQKVIFKPRRYEKTKVFEDFEEGFDRHNGEIAAFHVARLLNMPRAPLVAGRHLNLTEEILPFANQEIKDTFFTKGKDVCFYGVCRHCNGRESAVCGHTDILEGAVILWLPSKLKLEYIKHHNWTVTVKDDISTFEKNAPAYCERVADKYPYSCPTRLLDIVDMSVFDYIIGNKDRHDVLALGKRPSDGLLLLDNGKSFGNPFEDSEAILSPLIQCCRLRKTTWKRLLLLRNGVLSEVLRDMLENDMASPVLDAPHYSAMDRRIHIILENVEKCVLKHGVSSVLK